MQERTKEKIRSVSESILLAVGAVGLLSIASMAPNAVQLLKYLDPSKRKIKLYELNLNTRRLLDKKLIRKVQDGTHEFLEITEKGRFAIIKHQIEGLKNSKNSKWDKRYRVVIFDIAEYKRKVRDRLRNILRGFGFLCLQGSVWIYPYDCNEIIVLLKEYLKLDREIIYMTVDSIENDKWLRKNFDL